MSQRRSGVRVVEPLSVLFLAAAWLAGPLTSQAQAPARVLSARLSAREIGYGSRVTIQGALGESGRPLGGELLEAQADAYPFRGFVRAAVTRTRDDGTYVFDRLKPGRNTRYRVVLRGPGMTASPTLTVTVDSAHVLRSHSHGPGATRLALAVRHTRALGSPAVRVFWFVAPGREGRFKLATESSTRELRPGLTYTSAFVDPPAKRFAYRVCLRPAWGPAMGLAAARRPCPHRGDGSRHLLRRELPRRPGGEHLDGRRGRSRPARRLCASTIASTPRA